MAVEGDTAVAVVVVVVEGGPGDVAAAALGDGDSSHTEIDHTKAVTSVLATASCKGITHVVAQAQDK